MSHDSEGKTITIDNTDGNVSSVTVEQHGAPTDEGLSIGGLNLNTDLPWDGDAFMLLLLAALVYIGKKYIDKLFAKGRPFQK